MSKSPAVTANERRAASLTALQDGTLDVLIVGGGIVGAGIARDAALRGLRTGLVEQHDFAFGTSSRSSRLLHGGLRYLAQGRIGLVRESSREKKVIQRIAPHLTEPLPFVFPTYAGNRHWVLWQLKIGIKIYDLLCGGGNLGKSTWLRTDEVLTRVSSLETTGLKGAVRYYDGFTNDARLTIDTLRSAARAGATVLNYCQFKNAQRADLWTCDLEDRLTGRGFSIRAKAVVNATGPWAEAMPHSRVKLRLTKGIHLVVEHVRLPVSETVVMTEGKRLLFAIPWGERIILGTTDTDHVGSPDEVRAGEEDVRYVLEITNRFFPAAQLRRADVLSTWAGLRPLIANADGNPSDISRSHQIRNPESGWWDVAGGKLTTYRLMAEQTVNRIVRKQRLRAAACRTATEPLLPPGYINETSGILSPPFTRKVVAHYVDREWAVHLDDVMLRRTSWQHYERDAGERVVEAARWMGEMLGWTETDCALEAERVAVASKGLLP